MSGSLASSRSCNQDETRPTANDTNDFQLHEAEWLSVLTEAMFPDALNEHQFVPCPLLHDTTACCPLPNILSAPRNPAMTGSITTHAHPHPKKWKARELRSDDAVMIDPRPDDIIIPVMGMTGTGKSTFINILAGREVVRVGHSLTSCTSQLEDIHIPLDDPKLGNRRLILVDTPGFDDTYVDDPEILRRIAVWLAVSYSDGMELGGIIYLHDISQPRMTGSTRQDFEIFQKLCGKKAAERVVLVTTKWGNCDQTMAARNEKQLVGSYWKEMISLGSRAERFTGTYESAWTIVRHLVDRVEASGPRGVRIQEELVDMGRLLPNTDAGMKLRQALEDLLQVQKNLERELERSAKNGGNDARERYKENHEQIRHTIKQMQELRIPLSVRILAIFGLA